MPTAISKDGTAVAYDKTGQGPGLILVNGALAYRKLYGEKDLADKLAENFTVIYFDRRGRGETSDSKPYAAEREIEDIEALIDEAGGRAYLYGSSSGAALSLLAAEKLGSEKIIKLALYEPAYSPDNTGFAEKKKKVNELAAAGKPGDAIVYFMESSGASPDDVEGMKKSPDWEAMERIGHTLVYDFEVLGNGAVPRGIAKNITMPALVMNGGESFDTLNETADILAKVIPGALRKTIEGQTHEATAEAMAPVLKEFFVS